MTLSNVDIELRLAAGDLVITPAPFIGPCSVDLTLGSSFARIRRSETHQYLSLEEEVQYDRYDDHASYVLQPGDFCLATSVEWLEIPADLRGRLDGRSSVGRKGLFIHNAGFFDSGFKGQATLELFNATHMPFRLTPGARICQIEFTKCLTPTSIPYNGKYQGQMGATESRSHLDKEFQK